MCIEAGMDDYLSKPISSISLHTVLSKFIHPPDKGGKDVKTPVEIMEPAVVPDASAPDLPEKLVVDLTRLRELTGDDAAIMQELVQLFITDTDEHAALLRTAVEKLKWSAIV